MLNRPGRQSRKRGERESKYAASVEGREERRGEERGEAARRKGGRRGEERRGAERRIAMVDKAAVVV
jgi:hypothetical protein